MLKKEDERIQIKVDRFLSSEGVDGLGDQPFVCTRLNYFSLHLQMSSLNYNIRIHTCMHTQIVII